MTQSMKIMFSKFLTDTDIKKRLAIPVKILPSLPDLKDSHALEIHLMYGTRAWPVEYSIRKVGYKKPVFTSGWRDFVIHNNFNVGDRLTMYKVQDEGGSFHYKVEVEKKIRPSGSNNLSSYSTLSLNSEADETTATCRTKVSNFKQEQLPNKAAGSASASNKNEAAIVKIPDVATDHVQVPVAFDHVIAKPSGAWMFGNNVSDEVTSKANFKTTELQKGVCMGEPRSLKEEAVINLFGLADEAAGEAYYKSTRSGESLRSDLVVESSTTTLNLDLTLAPPIMDGGQNALSPVFFSLKNPR